MRELLRGLGRTLVILALLVSLASPTLAQDQPDRTPYYGVPVLPQRKAWLQWVMGSLFTALCLIGAMKNPHRTHLD